MESSDLFTSPPSPPIDDAARRTTEERFHAIVHQATAGVAELDATGQYTLVNQKFCDVVGYSAPELLRLGFRDLVHPDDLPRCLTAFAQAMATCQPSVDEKRLIRKDGTVIWVTDCITVICHEGGQPPRAVMVTVDITARVRTEEFLRRSEEHFRLVVDSVRDYVIFTLDAKGHVSTWNEGGVRLKGYRAEEILGRHVSIFATPEDRAAGVAEGLMATAVAHGRAEGECWAVRKDGTRFWDEELLFPMRDAEGDLLGFVKICRDLTERKAAEDERARLLAAEQAARREAEAANAAKDRFLAALSHELRTPLAPVQMALYILRREPDLSAAAQEGLEMIRRNIEAEARLIDDLLDISRIVHGKMEMTPGPATLHACVRRAVETCGGDVAAKAQGLTVMLEAKDDGIEGDAARLQQVFCNLLTNAAKFTPHAGRISVRSSNRPGWISIEVQDTGIGIEAAALPRLFNAFEQGTPDTARLYGGLGLGLAISHAIIQAHGGRLTAASAGLDRGATFTVELPLRGATPATA